MVLAPILALFDGLELAGPHLSAATYRAGMFDLPPVGDTPTVPKIAYGNQGSQPRPSYSGIADTTII